MTGDERVRACSVCDKQVFNISEMTRAEAQALLVARNGDWCTRYYQRADGTILLADCAIVKGRRARRLAAAAFAIVSAVATSATAEPPSAPAPPPPAAPATAKPPAPAKTSPAKRLRKVAKSASRARQQEERARLAKAKAIEMRRRKLDDYFVHQGIPPKL